MTTVLSLRFPAGRYHATRWGSHANEADIEWPPSPWRILRALVAAWHRKLWPAQFPEDLLATLIDRLSLSDAFYRLPPIVRAHTRHYMPVGAAAADRKIVFDAFARVDPDDDVVVAWPGVTLDDRERDLLVALVHVTGYLGRAESWLEARVMEGYEGTFDCAPAGAAYVADPATHEPVSLLAPIAAPRYAEWRDRTISELGLESRRLTKAQKRVIAMLPDRLIDALRVETGDLRAAGWNLPPGGRMVTYYRPRSGVATAPRRPHRAGRAKPITTARLALAGRPLPRIEDAVRIGELVRAATLRAADRIGNGKGVPSEISGHGSDKELNHRHAFYLPEDADGDGFIDHVVIHAPGGLSRQAVEAIDQLHRRGLWTRDGEEWAVVFEGAWDAPAATDSRYCQAARKWVSITPYLHPWYAKQNFGVIDQLRRECAERGLPTPVAVGILPSIRIADRERRSVHFHRFRSKRGLRQPDSRGSIVEITFAETVSGPLALGFGCHYGLGIFAPSTT